MTGFGDPETPETPAGLLRDAAEGKRHSAATLQAWVARQQDEIEVAQIKTADLLRQGAELEQAADRLDGVTS